MGWVGKFPGAILVSSPSPPPKLADGLVLGASLAQPSHRLCVWFNRTKGNLRGPREFKGTYDVKHFIRLASYFSNLPAK